MPKSRGVLIAGNWKMNHGPTSTREFFAQLGSGWTSQLSSETFTALSSGKLKVCLFPPSLNLKPAQEACGNLPIDLGAQNVHWEKSGAFTGEISGPMLKELGVTTALVGHSERRQYFGETDETARKRAESLLEQGFRVILCIGETQKERESGQTLAILTRQLSSAFPDRTHGCSKHLNGNLILAYEPVWAIGTGLTATPEQAEAAHALIRGYLRDHLGARAAEKTAILYGGSVTPENIASLLACPNIDGALVGGASIKPGSVLSLVNAGGQAASS